MIDQPDVSLSCRTTTACVLRTGHKQVSVTVFCDRPPPEVAQTLAGLGVSFESITTRSSLQSVIVYAFQFTREVFHEIQGQKDMRSQWTNDCAIE